VRIIARHLLDRFRLTAAIQPKDWLTFYGEVQDSRIFFQVWLSFSDGHTNNITIHGTLETDPLSKV
jgi:hypothetical protein